MARVYNGTGRYLARSKDVELDPVLDEIAARIESHAIGLAAANIETGDYVSSIEVRKDRLSPSGRDRLVVSTDPAALAIEFGHLSGRRGDANRRPVPGQHIIQRAADTA